MRRAAVDIGSNSLLLLIIGDDAADPPGRTLIDRVEVVGLGRGLGDGGAFQADRMDHAARVLASFADEARCHGVPKAMIRAVATSAARRAHNAPAFFDRIAKETGIEVRIISGEEEARLTWKGAGSGLDLGPGPGAVVDLGGGSTEIAWGTQLRAGAPSGRCSLEIGSVRLTETHFGPTPQQYDPSQVLAMQAAVREIMSSASTIQQPDTVVAVAGTATTLAAMDLGLVSWNRDIVHGHRLNTSALDGWRQRLAVSTATQRKDWAAVSPERADYLLAGATVLHEAARRLGVSELIISDGGVRHGLVQEP